jgi:hypothetical protein
MPPGAITRITSIAYLPRFRIRLDTLHIANERASCVCDPIADYPYARLCG